MFGSASKCIKLEDEGSAGIVETNDELDNVTEAAAGTSANSGSAKLTTATLGQGPVTYKLISPSGSGAATVLTTPMSGQFYVIGNPSDVSPASSVNSGRVIAPKATITIANSPNLAGAGGTGNNDSSNGSRRIDRRKATHNEVERRRRDTINAWIMQLAKIIPGLDMDDPDRGPSKGGALSKGGILAKACDYVQEITEDNKALEKRVQELENVAVENERLMAALEETRQDNALLKQQLENAGIVISSESIEDILS